MICTNYVQDDPVGGIVVHAVGRKSGDKFNLIDRFWNYSKFETLHA